MKTGSAVHFLFLIALLLAIFARSIIPVGFMTDSSSNKIALTICSGLTTKTVFVEDKSAPSGSHQETKHEACPFAPPVLADNIKLFNTIDYISISYAPFLPDPTAHISIAAISLKAFFSQGPPRNFVA